MIAEQVAAEFGRGEVGVIGPDRAVVQPRGQERADVGRGVGQLALELALRADQFLLSLDELALRGDGVEHVQLVLGQAGQFGHGVALRPGELAGLAVGDAERADVVPIGPGKGEAGVEADERVAGDHRVVVEAPVPRGVEDDQRFALEDRVAAE